jgi:sec-independent protein translocase protein TatA
MAFGQTEILIIVLIVIILFGAATIPKLARSLGRAQGEFKKAKGEFEKEMKSAESESSVKEASVKEAPTKKPEDGDGD